jgi:nucleoid DNA-binding protein
LLRPKKSKEYIPVVAEELSIPDKLVEDVINYYWQEVRKSLSSMKHSRIHISNLGDFVVKHWKLDEEIKFLEKWEESNKQKGMQQMTARFKTVENLLNLKAVKEVMKEEGQRKDFIKLHKKRTNVIKK